MASYPNSWVDDGKLWCYATIAETGSYSVAYSSGGWTALEVDDVAVTSSLTQTLSAGDHILKFTLSDPTVIPEGMFRSITIYSMICFPSGTTTIGNYLFYPCSAATTVVMDKSKITSIGVAAFKQASVEIGDLYFPNLITLGIGAFDQHSGGNNYQIKSLGNVTTIPDYCFSQSPYKTYVIPSTVTSLGSQSLLSWDYDKTIVCYADTPPTVGSLWVYRSPVAIYVPTNSVAAYKEASGWSSYASIIYPIWEEKKININHLSLGDFRRRVIMGISKPKPLYPDPWVDDGKIWAYVNVTTIESATTLGYSLNRYRGMEIDGVSVTPANSYQFATTGEHLVKLDISGGMYAFSFNATASLVRLYLPGSRKNIPNDFCKSCGNLTFIHIPSEVESVGQRSFMQNSNAFIKDLSLPALTEIGSGCFTQVKIKKISDLGSITSLLGNYTLSNNTTLESVVLPATLESIGGYVFDGDTSLKTITSLATTPPTWGTSSFRSVTPDVVYVPATSVNNYKTASGWSGWEGKIQAIPE